MPIYEYLCQSCGRFEVKQKFSDPAVTACARCGQAVTRLISAPAIMFKGSGWYVTDYSDKMKAPAEGNGKAAEERADAKSDKAAAKSDTKTDTKSETQSETKTSETKSDAASSSSTSTSSSPSKDSSSSGGSSSTPAAS
ncbi:MAG TPA: FmdB family zinc ribbon protein [Nitrospiraceae bacterium]|nr:FmdB family zinc ribbon protein [Nitrospiraceae bacterium]